MNNQGGEDNDSNASWGKEEEREAPEQAEKLFDKNKFISFVRE
jgi:hypothetical protein